MTVYSLTFKLQSDSLYNKMSRMQPEAEFNLWCNYSRHVMEVTFGKASSPESVLRTVRKMAHSSGTKILRDVPTAKMSHLMVMSCTCARAMPSTWSVIAKYNCLDLQPTTYTAGWEQYRVLAFSSSDIRSLLEELSHLSKVEIQSQSNKADFSMMDNFVLSMADLFGKMTAKQSEALRVALRSGYYSRPRRVSTDQIARSLGRPGPTYREHLLKAETKLLQAVGPYLELAQIR